MPLTAPLRPRALYQEVAERLRLRIFKRELAPGEWIDELKIAAELGISRTPLREALKVLAAEGLVTMKLRRGAYVTEVSEQDLREVYELLALLESDAAAAACRRASAEQLLHLQKLHQQLEAAAQAAPEAALAAADDPPTDARPSTPERFLAANEAFHLQLLQLAGNRWRMQVVADLRKVMKLNRHGSLLRQGRLQESLHEHRALMAALQARDPEQARQRMAAHFAQGLRAAI
ncbi:MAG: GntR family transcriptional regulator [Serpentinimonas sp.]|nr:GntR family transcriptional regulator [Serpentinimonas sp.]MDO9610304.1 GntR family transcriptional regulator [Serpentinimonas sp.]